MTIDRMINLVKIQERVMFNSYEGHRRSSSIYNTDIIPETEYDEGVKRILESLTARGESAQLKTIVGAAIKLAVDKNMNVDDFETLMDVAKAIYKFKHQDAEMKQARIGRPG